MRIAADELTRIVTRIFAAAGSSPEEAACIARHLVDSDLVGHESHGVLRVIRYVQFLQKGDVVANATPEIVVDTPTALAVDGRMGYGQVIGELAIDRLAAKAKAAGVAIATIRRSGHLGRLGDWAERLAGHGLVSLHFLNTTGLGMMAVPFGGTDRRLSLCPLAIAVPVAGRHPVLLDMTTTTVAEGKLAWYRNKGEPIPEGWIVDKHGHPSTDPNDFYAGGALLPIAGHKGHGLCIMADILAGSLSGGGCTRPGVTSLENTMTSIAIDPGPLVDPTAWADEIRRFADWVTGSPPARPDGEVLMPGDIEHRHRIQRLADGILLDPTTWSQIEDAARLVGLEPATLRS